MTNAYRFLQAPKIEFFPAAKKNEEKKAIYHSVIQRIPTEQGKHEQSEKRGQDSDETESSDELIDENHYQDNNDKDDHVVGTIHGKNETNTQKPQLRNDEKDDIVVGANIETSPQPEQSSLAENDNRTETIENIVGQATEKTSQKPESTTSKESKQTIEENAIEEIHRANEMRHLSESPTYEEKELYVQQYPDSYQMNLQQTQSPEYASHDYIGHYNNDLIEPEYFEPNSSPFSQSYSPIQWPHLQPFSTPPCNYILISCKRQFIINDGNAYRMYD